MSAASTNNQTHIAMCLKAPVLDRGAQIRQQVVHFEALAASEQQTSSTSPPTSSSSSAASFLRRTIFTGDGRPSLKERWRLREEKRRQSQGSAIERPSAPAPHSAISPASISPPSPIFALSLSPEPSKMPARRSISPPRPPRSPRTPQPSTPTMESGPESCPLAPQKERASRPIPIPTPKGRVGSTRACADDDTMGELLIGMSFEGVESIPHLIEMVERAADEWSPSI